jgi:cell division protein FtsW (lipid II flippase)
VIKNKNHFMKTMPFYKSIILFTFLCGFILLTGYLRDQVDSQNSKLWISLGSTTILAMAVVINLYFKEKQLQKPDYKKYFFSTFFIFLFVLVAVILRK